MAKREAHNYLSMKLLFACSNTSSQENVIVSTRCILDCLSYTCLKPLQLPPPSPGLVSLNLLAYHKHLVGPLSNEFVTNTEKDPNFLVVNTDSGSPNIDQANQWANDTSGGKITTIATSSELYGCNMMLRSKNIFSGVWNNGFDKRLTRKQKFRMATGEKMMDMMTGEITRLPIYQTEDATAVRFGYTKSDSFFAFMPHKIATKQLLLKKLANLNLEEIFSKMVYRNVETVMPKFKYTCKYGISPLIDYGQFDGLNYDFSRVFEKGRPGQYISHTTESTIDNNEDGTTTTAEASIYAYDCMYDGHHIICKLDRPFIYFILDRSKNIISAGLFVHGCS